MSENIVFKEKNWSVYNNKITRLLSDAKRRAKSKGLPFNLTREDIVIPEFCPVLGQRLLLDNHSGDVDWSPALDRINNDRGYERGNVMVISFRANTLKNSASVEELEKIYNFYKKLQVNKYLVWKYNNEEKIKCR